MPKHLGNMASKEPGRKLVTSEVDSLANPGFHHGFGLGERPILQYVGPEFVTTSSLMWISDEAGYEAFASEGDSRVESTQYTEKAFVMTRSFIKRALERPVPDFEDVLAWHYLPGTAANEGPNRPELLMRAITEARNMIDHYNSTYGTGDGETASPASSFVARLSLGAIVMLRKHISALEGILSEAEKKVEV